MNEIIEALDTLLTDTEVIDTQKGQQDLFEAELTLVEWLNTYLGVK